MSFLEDISNAISPGLGSVISGGLGFLGQMDTNATSQSNAQSANAFNAQQAQINRDYQTEMSNTAYQRQVKDMEAAGLNPMLAYIKGGGASTPSGSTATANVPNYVSPIQGMAQYKLTSAQASKTEAEKPKVEAETRLTEQEIEKVKALTSEIEAKIAYIKGDTNFDVQQNKLKQTAFMLQQQAVKYQEEGITQGQQRAVMQATINNLQKQGELLSLDIKAAKAFDNLGRTYKELQPIVELMKSILVRR